MNDLNTEKTTICLLLSCLLLLGNYNLDAQTQKDSLPPWHYQKQGNINLMELKHEKAIQQFEKAIVLYNELEQWDSSIICLIRTSQVQRNKSNGKLGLEELKRGLAIYDEKLNEGQPILGLLYANIAQQYFRKKDSILYYSSLAIPILEKHYGPNHVEIGELYSWQGLMYENHGHRIRALECYHKALEIFKVSEGVSAGKLKRCYVNAGYSYYQLKAYSQALKYFEESFELAQGLHLDHCGHTLVVLFNIANCSLKNGNSEAYFPYFQQVLSCFEKVYGKGSYRMTMPYSLMAEYYAEQGRHDSTLYYFDKAVAVLRTKVHSVYKIKTFYSLAAYHYKQGNHKEAITLLEKNLEKLKKSVLYNTRTPSILLLSKILQEEGAIADALVYVQKGLKYSLPDFDPAEDLYVNPSFEHFPLDVGMYYDLMCLKSKLLFKNYQQTCEKTDLEAAYRSFLLADKLLERQQDWLVRNADIITIFEAERPFFEGAIETCYLLFETTKEKRYLKDAFYFSERSRANVLQQALSQQTALKTSQLPDSLLSQKQLLQEDIAYYESEIFNAYQKRDSAQVKKNERSLFHAQEAFRTFLAHLEKHYPKDFESQINNRIMGVDQIQNSLLGHEQGLLEYFVGEQAIYVFSISNSDIIVEKLLDPAALAAQIQELRGGLTDYWLTLQSCTEYTELQSQPYCQDLDSLKVIYDNRFTSYAYKLYQNLVAPIALQHTLPRRLYIIPDGILGYLPFETLLKTETIPSVGFRNYDYLLHHHQISYFFSASLLVQNVTKPQTRGADYPLIAFAPFSKGSSFELDLEANKDHESMLSSIRSNSFKPLPFSGLEVENIHKIWGGLEFHQKKATKARFEELATRSAILHLASHAKAHDEKSEYSSIAFASDSAQFVPLLVSEIYNLQIPAEMVVLSACETGIGNIKKGEGIESLARAFTYAGAKSIFTTLWSVQDQASATLMQDFYENLKSGQQKDEALWNAKMNYLSNSDNRLAHPYFWASYIPMGNMQAFETNSTSRWLLISLSLVIGFMVFRKFKGES